MQRPPSSKGDCNLPVPLTALLGGGYRQTRGGQVFADKRDKLPGKKLRGVALQAEFLRRKRMVELAAKEGPYPDEEIGRRGTLEDFWRDILATGDEHDDPPGAQ